jgi:BlaI family penicillinase repressor
MRSKEAPRPTDAELAILQVLWRRGPSTVKEVQEELKGGTGYTTALKMLQIMTAKGTVARDEASRAHVYRPAFTREQVQRTLLGGLLDKAFLGSASALVMQALSSKRATAAELKEIRALVERLSGEGK